MRTDRRRLLAVAAAGLLARPAMAQAWPSRPIRLVVPFAPGGGSDVIARLLSEDLARSLGVPVVVENRPGQAASLGADFVAKAPPDGHTILIATPGVQMTNPFLYPSLPYDAERDFAPVIHLAELPNVLVVHPAVPADSTAALVALLKANPGRYNFSSTGSGSSSHLAAELFKSLAGVDIVHVPYRGSGPALIDLIAGRVQMAVDSFTAMMPAARQGQLRALGISTLRRVAEAPELPPIAEALPGYEASTLLYITAPAQVPPAVIARLNAAFNEALAVPRVREKFRELGMVPTGGDPAFLARVIETDRAKWQRVIEISGARAE